jgi:signal transduction histidine kinase
MLDANGQIVTRVEKIILSDTMNKIISGALDKKTESYKFRDSSGNIVVCAYQPIMLPGKSEPWSVIVFQKETDNISIVLLVSMFVFLVLCSFLIMLKLINYNILKPVLEIQKGMAQIVEGKLDIRVDGSKNNEIGELAGDINKMVDSLKLHQQRIDEDEKLAALGNIVAGVAHEINTPLGIGVTTSTYMKKINDEYRIALNEGRFTKKDLVEYMESMNESLELLLYNLERGAHIIQSFKRIAIDQTYETQEEFNVLEYIDSVVISLTHEYKKSNHKFCIMCDENLSIKSYPGIFAQILTNLIMNSVIHAFNGMENGRIEIQAFMEGEMFVLHYSDNGCGISEENLQKIFTPFFTTRKNSGGSGLGLNIVKNLITQKLNGTITAESELGNGATFIIKIPV